MFFLKPEFIAISYKVGQIEAKAVLNKEERVEKKAWIITLLIVFFDWRHNHVQQFDGEEVALVVCKFSQNVDFS